MFRRVIVGVDGDTGGRDAIALARALVDPDGGALWLAHVYVLTPVGASSRDYADNELNPSAQLLRRERDATGVDAQLISRAASSVGRGLHSICDSEAADLLVVGSTRRGLAGRVLVGDQTRASLQRATCAVALAPLGYAASAGGIARVGAESEDGSGSEAALAVAREIAAARGAVLAPVVDGVDLVVLDSHAHGMLRRHTLASTAEQLVHDARCPLLVLPPARD